MATVNKTMKTFNVPSGSDTICYEIFDDNGRKCIAKDWYANSTAKFNAGEYVIKDGICYKFKVNHAANTSWSASEVVATNLGSELSDVKSAFTSVEKTIGQKKTSSDFSWTLKKTISNTGEETTANGFALSSYISIGAGYCVVNDSGDTGYNSKNSSFWVHQYNGSTWLRRDSIKDGQNVKLADNCTRIRIAYGYPAAESVTITQAIVDSYFSMIVLQECETKENSEKAINANNDYIQRTSEKAYGTQMVTFKRGMISITDAVAGDIIDIDNPTESKYMYAVVPCQEGDKFTVTLFVGATSRCLAFLTSSKAFISGGKGEKTNVEYTAPENAAYAVFITASEFNSTPYRNYSVIKGANLKSYVDAIDTRLTTAVDSLENTLIDTLPYVSTGNGFMRANGEIYGDTADKIRKYEVPAGALSIYISGTVNWDVASPAFCVLWFVKDGAMMSGEYIPATTKPQTWNMYEVEIPSTAEEIWADRQMTIYTTNQFDGEIAKRLTQLENDSSLIVYGEGPYTWADRVTGLRVLADAQGCYFIPFNALGLGVNRANGTYGNDYIIDNIHPTQLGAYNIALGVWSYLRHIPCWYTSVPSPVSQPLDGSQWNGKTWYAYGTSLTEGTTSNNKYADFVATMSGMTLVNKGNGGGALVTNRQIYNRLLDMEDGKLNADLITIEVGANDHNEIGKPCSLDVDQFYGALNHCIEEMYKAGVQAQIVIMASYSGRYLASDSTKKFNVDRLLNK